MPLRPVESSGTTRSRVVAQDYNTPTPLFFKSCDVERFRTFFRFRFPHPNPNYSAVLQRPFFFGRSPPPFCNCDSRDLFQLEGSLYRCFSSGFELDHTRLGIC